MFYIKAVQKLSLHTIISDNFFFKPRNHSLQMLIVKVRAPRNYELLAAAIRFLAKYWYSPINEETVPMRPTCHDSNRPPQSIPEGRVLPACTRSSERRTIEMSSMRCFTCSIRRAWLEFKKVLLMNKTNLRVCVRLQHLPGFIFRFVDVRFVLLHDRVTPNRSEKK